MVFESFPADNSIEDKALGFAIEQTDEFEQTNYDLEITVFPGERIHVRFGFNSEAFTISLMSDSDSTPKLLQYLR